MGSRTTIQAKWAFARHRKTSRAQFSPQLSKNPASPEPNLVHANTASGGDHEVWYAREEMLLDSPSLLGSELRQPRGDDRECLVFNLGRRSGRWPHPAQLRFIVEVAVGELPRDSAPVASFAHVGTRGSDWPPGRDVRRRGRHRNGVLGKRPQTVTGAATLVDSQFEGDKIAFVPGLRLRTIQPVWPDGCAFQFREMVQGAGSGDVDSGTGSWRRLLRR